MMNYNTNQLQIRNNNKYENFPQSHQLITTLNGSVATSQTLSTTATFNNNINSSASNGSANVAGSEDEISKKLPKEILLRILSYLDVVSLCRCAQVSKYWNILALDGSNWQKIDLFYFQMDIEGPVIENISQRCGGFLKYLSLKGCQSVGDQSIRTLAQHCHNIEHLDLTECKKITDAAIDPLSKHCPKLTAISLESCSLITDLSMKALSDGCPNILEINISWCHLISENGIEALARGCNKIKKFSSKDFI
jgi:F-box/leucine-rich repeat protein 2/20